MRLSRRRFLAGSTAALGSLALGWEWGCTNDVADPPAGLPDPASSGIDHVVVVVMENRSFDHFLGWLPGADGRQAGLTFTDAIGAAHSTFPLAPDFQGCAYTNPDNSFAGGRLEYNEGACDGWLRANGLLSIGYYRSEDLSFLGRAAVDWMSFDRYFCATLSQTAPNRIYLCAAQTDRLNNTAAPTTLPTIFDRMADAGLEARHYYSNVEGVMSLWGTKYDAITESVDTFYANCAAGTLPSVSFVDPPFGGIGRWDSEEDDHPFADIRAGETFLNRVYAALTQGPAWQKTALIITFDEWGGFFDHVPPPAAPIPDADRAAGNTDGLLGFRVPTLLISPFARRRYVAHQVYDHTSILRLIEWRWGLLPLSVRDATANNLAMELDFTTPTLDAPVYPVPDVSSMACPTST